MSLVLDKVFQKQFDTLKNSPTHAILLHGTRGVGLRTIALELAQQQSIIIVEPTQKKDSSVLSITVARIRELHEEVRSRLEQCVIIDNADLMTEAAQNALLKILEEPNNTTRFIFTSHSPEKLLPTIHSRLQSFFVPRVNDLKIPTDGITSEKQSQLRFMADGRPAELHRLLNDEAYFTEQSQVIISAKKILNATQYELIAILQKEKLNRQMALSIIEILCDILSRVINEQHIKKIQRLVNAYEVISRGGNPRLQLLNAMV